MIALGDAPPRFPPHVHCLESPKNLPHPRFAPGAWYTFNFGLGAPTRGSIRERSKRRDREDSARLRPPRGRIAMTGDAVEGDDEHGGYSTPTGCLGETRHDRDAKTSGVRLTAIPTEEHPSAIGIARSRWGRSARSSSGGRVFANRGSSIGEGPTPPALYADPATGTCRKPLGTPDPHHLALVQWHRPIREWGLRGYLTRINCQKDPLLSYEEAERRKHQSSVDREPPETLPET